MGMKFKIGDTVKQVVPVIAGPVTNVAIVDGDLAYEVSWKDAAGDDHARYFTEAELEKLADPANTEASTDTPAA